MAKLKAIWSIIRCRSFVLAYEHSNKGKNELTMTLEKVSWTFLDAIEEKCNELKWTKF